MEVEIHFSNRALAPSAPSFPLDGRSGAVIDFYGVVRGQEKGHPIKSLKYEAYLPMAERELRRICSELEERHPCRSVEFVHRIGPVETGEPSLHVRVWAVHRAEAFEFARQLIDRMKEDVPIWKI